jgi:hypothetical protein
LAGYQLACEAGGSKWFNATVDSCSAARRYAKIAVYFRVSEGKPMRLALPYLGIGLCASLAAWLSVLLLY